MTKEDLRNLLKTKRNSLPGKEEKSQRIIEHILSIPKFRQASVVMLYRSAKGEVDTEDLWKKCRELGKICVFPKCISKTEMIAALAEREEDFSVCRFGISEPVSDEAFPKEKIDVVIVPALGFDRQNYRVGYGGGYYDRYLSDYHGTAIGLCFSELLSETVYPNDWDIPVDFVITQDGIL